MRPDTRKPTSNLATVFNKPYPPPKQWLYATLTRDNQRIATMKIEASMFDAKVATWRKNGYDVEEAGK